MKLSYINDKEKYQDVKRRRLFLPKMIKLRKLLMKQMNMKDY